MSWTGEFGGDGHLDADARFVDESGDFRVRAGSPGIDAGDNTALPKDQTVDLLLLPRFVDDPNTPDTGRGDPPLVDMGAYEFQADVCTGRDRMKAFCKNRRGRNVIVARLRKGMAEQPITFRMDDDPQSDRQRVTGENGKVRVTFKQPEDGRHRVMAVECPSSVGVECP